MNRVDHGHWKPTDHPAQRRERNASRYVAANHGPAVFAPGSSVALEIPLGRGRYVPAGHAVYRCSRRVFELSLRIHGDSPVPPEPPAREDLPLPRTRPKPGSSTS
jgi:hypothetical protein